LSVRLFFFLKFHVSPPFFFRTLTRDRRWPSSSPTYFEYGRSYLFLFPFGAPIRQFFFSDVPPLLFFFVSFLLISSTHGSNEARSFLAGQVGPLCRPLPTAYSFLFSRACFSQKKFFLTMMLLVPSGAVVLRFRPTLSNFFRLPLLSSPLRPA